MESKLDRKGLPIIEAIVQLKAWTGDLRVVVVVGCTDGQPRLGDLPLMSLSSDERAKTTQTPGMTTSFHTNKLCLYRCYSWLSPCRRKKLWS